MINTNDIAKEYRMAHWAQIMQERVASGMNIKEYCKHIGICGNTYFYWQRRLRAAACEQLSEPHPTRQSFAEIKVVEPLTLPVLGESVQGSQIRIEFQGVQMTVDNLYPPDKLAILIRGLVQS